MSPHELAKSVINAAAGLFGARVVSADWGPRGVSEVLQRVKSRGFSPALVFDIGAYDGRWTLNCRRLFQDARYVLVDPLAAHREALAGLAQSDERVTFFHGVAGAHAGTVQLYEHDDQSSVLPSGDFPGAMRDVESTTVDALYDAQGCVGPVLLKADVQGYELEVLKGAGRCLAATEILILEVSFRQVYKESALAHEIVSYVGDRGFRMFEICSYLQRATDRDLLQSDFVFVHESSPLFGRHGWT